MLLSPGTHRIKVELPGYQTFETEVTLVAGQKSVVKTDLEKGSIHQADPLINQANNSSHDKCNFFGSTPGKAANLLRPRRRAGFDSRQSAQICLFTAVDICPALALTVLSLKYATANHEAPLARLYLCKCPSRRMPPKCRALGCRRARENSRRAKRPKNVLVIGASTGYGLASRIAAAWGYGAKTLGVFFERPPEGDKTATAGHYNTVAFHSLAKERWPVCREHQRRRVFR